MGVKGNLTGKNLINHPALQHPVQSHPMIWSPSHGQHGGPRPTTAPSQQKAIPKPSGRPEKS
jgi:hypothetical protein